jgi:Sigma-70, region 4
LYDDDPPGPLGAIDDDRLRLIFTCCHPALAMETRVALTLRMVGGLTVPEIARALLVQETTMEKRITRAKAKIKAARIPYRVPSAEDLPARVSGVLTVLFLIFNEGYLATGSGTDPVRHDLTAEAIRLTRLIRALMPEDGEVAGLLALMLLSKARRTARVSASGELVTLDEQDRGASSHRPLQPEIPAPAPVIKDAPGSHQEAVPFLRAARVWPMRHDGTAGAHPRGAAVPSVSQAPPSPGRIASGQAFRIGHQPATANRPSSAVVPGKEVTGMRYRLVVRVTAADIGQRVTIRWRPAELDGSTLMTDVLGTLEDADDQMFKVRRDRDGQLVVIPRTRAIAGKVVPPARPPRRPPRAPHLPDAPPSAGDNPQ